jgi:ABC-type transporter Mla subunit MlaD
MAMKILLAQLKWPLVLLLVVGLTACDQGLHFSIRYDEAAGLQAGDALILNGQTVGRVVAVEPQADRGQLVRVVVDRQFANAATADSRFYVIDNAQHPERKSIEVTQSSPGGKPIEEGAVVIGSARPGLNLFPFAEILKEFGGMLRDLRDQVERFRQQFEQLPDTAEARQLKEEWQRLLKELNEAQSSAEGSVKKDLIPKLQEQLDAIRRQLDELRKAAPPKNKPVET